MGLYIRSLIFSIMLGISCREYFETILSKRRKRHGWAEKMEIPVFVLGFMVISASPIPPYIFMPVRVIGIIWLIVQFYYEVKWISNLVLSLFFTGIIWILSSITVSILNLLSIDGKMIEYLLDPILCSILLFFMMVFSYKLKGKIDLLNRRDWIYFGLFPLLSIIVLMIMTVWGEEVVDHDAWFILITGFSIVSILIFYFIYCILRKDSIMQNMRVENELANNQMSMYRNMEQNYQRQRKYMHDYKNQLNCIQGLLEKEQLGEALDYVKELTGGIQKSEDYVDTNHRIINVILNQKYQYAQENGVTIIVAVNDLSHLTMKKEELVILLSNLLDNAIEACKIGNADKVIQFKMVIEEGNLILSVKNPMGAPLKIREGKIISSKKNQENHGIGLMNVENVIKRNHGTSSVKCEDGYFSFSAMIPV